MGRHTAKQPGRAQHLHHGVGDLQAVVLGAEESLRVALCLHSQASQPVLLYPDDCGGGQGHHVPSLVPYPDGSLLPCSGA